MKKIALLTVVLMCATTMAYAHCGFCKLDKEMKPGDWVQKKVEKMTEKLGLTEEQVGQIEPLIKEKIEKKKAAKEEARTKMDAIKEEYSAKIKALLTDEQKVKYDEWKEEKEEMMKEKKEMMKEKMKGEGHEHMHKKMMDKDEMGSGDES